jgi:hypothetical protein
MRLKEKDSLQHAGIFILLIKKVQKEEKISYLTSTLGSLRISPSLFHKLFLPLWLIELQLALNENE